MNPLTDINLRVSLHQSTGYAMYLACLPLIAMYKTPGLSVGLATSLIAVGMVYAGCVVYRNFQKVDLSILMALLPYLTYVFFNGSSDAQLLTIAILIHLAAISTGAVDTNRLRYYLENVAVAAAFLVVIQQILHYGAHLNVKFMFTNLLIDSMKDEGGLMLQAEGTGLNRPSAFFHEPSHMAQTCIIGLGSCLYREVPKIKKALLVTMGFVACTSGMGLVLTAAMWGWWRISQEDKGVIYKVGIIVGVAIALVIAYFVLDQIPFTHSILNRFVGTDEGNYNAIEGRTFGWDILFAGKDFWELFWGFGPEALPKFYLTGFMSQLIVYGYAGVILLFVFLGRFILGSQGLARTQAIIYASLLFIANIIGFVFLIFQTGVIIALNYQYNHGDDE